MSKSDDKSERDYRTIPRMGRPTRLTPALIRKVCQYLDTGCYVETAVQLAGISKKLFYEWMKLSHKPDSNPIFKDFRDAIDKAIAAAEQKDIATIDRASGNSWQAAAWKLERRLPRKWGYMRRAETEGDDTDRPRDGVSLNYNLGDDAAANGKDMGNGKAESEADDDEEPAERQPTH